jgi:hypothetical protein
MSTLLKSWALARRAPCILAVFLLLLASCSESPPKSSFLCKQAQGSCRAFVDSVVQNSCEKDSDCEAAYIECGEAACQIPLVIGKAPLLAESKVASYQALVRDVHSSCGEDDAASAPASPCPSELPTVACVAGRCQRGK